MKTDIGSRTAHLYALSLFKHQKTLKSGVLVKLTSPNVKKDYNLMYDASLLRKYWKLKFFAILRIWRIQEATKFVDIDDDFCQRRKGSRKYHEGSRWNCSLYSNVY